MPHSIIQQTQVLNGAEKPLRMIMVREAVLPQGVTPDDVRVHLSEMLVGSSPAAATNTGEKGMLQGAAK